jgi:hypothetical protein
VCVPDKHLNAVRLKLVEQLEVTSDAALKVICPFSV